MTIVLHLKGKREDVDYAIVKTFESIQAAIDYVRVNSDISEEKYWNYCKIVDNGIEYEIGRYFIEP